MGLPTPRSSGGTSDPLEPEPAIDQVGVDASPAEQLDERASARDQAADERDRAAKTRDHDRRVQHGDHEPERDRLDRVFAERDRAAAALDRYEAALDRHRAAQYLKDAYRDRLTGVLQRDAGHDQLRHEFARARRRESPLVIAFIDVDRLKQTNDEHGHSVGDALLRAVGAALRAALRSYDIVVR